MCCSRNGLRLRIPENITANYNSSHQHELYLSCESVMLNVQDFRCLWGENLLYVSGHLTQIRKYITYKRPLITDKYQLIKPCRAPWRSILFLQDNEMSWSTEGSNEMRNTPYYTKYCLFEHTCLYDYLHRSMYTYICNCEHLFFLLCS